MLTPKRKRGHTRQTPRGQHNSWVWLLVIVLAGMVASPLLGRGSSIMDGEQWTDLLLVMAMFCCAIALFYQLGLRLLSYNRQPESVEVSSQVPEKPAQQEDV